jgi:hypothetical protein
LLYCPKCKAGMNAQDRFCPKCGTDVTAPHARTQEADVPTPPRQAEVDAAGGHRAGLARVPILAGGRKYPGLMRAAELMIRSTAIIRPLTLITAILGGLSVASWLRDIPTISIPAGVAVGIAITLLGWVVCLAQTVVGELMYVVMDVEESLRKRD